MNIFWKSSRSFWIKSNESKEQGHQFQVWQVYKSTRWNLTGNSGLRLGLEWFLFHKHKDLRLDLQKRDLWTSSWASGRGMFGTRLHRNLILSFFSVWYFILKRFICGKTFKLKKREKNTSCWGAYCKTGEQEVIPKRNCISKKVPKCESAKLK